MNWSGREVCVSDEGFGEQHIEAVVAVCKSALPKCFGIGFPIANLARLGRILLRGGSKGDEREHQEGNEWNALAGCHGQISYSLRLQVQIGWGEKPTPGRPERRAATECGVHTSQRKERSQEWLRHGGCGTADRQECLSYRSA